MLLAPTLSGLRQRLLRESRIEQSGEGCSERITGLSRSRSRPGRSATAFLVINPWRIVSSRICSRLFCDTKFSLAAEIPVLATSSHKSFSRVLLQQCLRIGHSHDLFRRNPLPGSFDSTDVEHRKHRRGCRVSHAVSTLGNAFRKDRLQALKDSPTINIRAGVSCLPTLGLQHHASASMALRLGLGPIRRFKSSGEGKGRFWSSYAETATLPLMQRKARSTAALLSNAARVAAGRAGELVMGRIIFRWFSMTTAPCF